MSKVEDKEKIDLSKYIRENYIDHTDYSKKITSCPPSEYLIEPNVYRCFSKSSKNNIGNNSR